MSDHATTGALSLIGAISGMRVREGTRQEDEGHGVRDLVGGWSIAIATGGVTGA